MNLSFNMWSRTLLLVFSVLSLFFSLGLSQKCQGQSCAIAALSGSTNESMDQILKGAGGAAGGGGKEPTGSSSAGKDCMTKYLSQLNPKTPGAMSRRHALTEELDMESATRKRSHGKFDIEKRQGCKPYTLLFARGTTEGGTMGATVGPALSSAVTRLGGANWRVEGIKYSADVAGINCIGLPGGAKCLDQLSKLASQCPQTKFVLSGYSQGAMVARICTAYSKDDIKKRIKAVVAFGDPFNGASVKGFPPEGVRTFCAASDGVCQGKFAITPGHLSYTTGSSISEAAKFIVQRAQT